MQNIIDFLARKEVGIVVIILVVAVAIYLILWFFSWIKKHEMKKKLKNNTMELNHLAEKVKIEEKKQKISPVITPIVKEKTVLEELISKKEEEPPVPKKEETKEEAIQYKDEVYTKEEAQEELKKIVKDLTEEQKKKEEILEPVIVEAPKEEVIEILEEEPNKEVEEDKNIALTAFENDQEKHAIISLEELLKKGKTITQEEIIQYEDEGDEPITLEELEARYKEEDKKSIEVIEKKEEPVRKEVKLMDFYEAKPIPYREENTYQPTPIISPIFGIEKDQIAKEKAIELENTATFEKFDKEIQKTNQFVARLKELQNLLQKESD